MPYTLIDLNHVFIYKSLPENMKDRVLKLPAHIEQMLLTPTGFSKVDSRLEKEKIQSINWKDFPERNLTQNSFLDDFTELVHQHGPQPLYFYRRKMNLKSIVDLNCTVRVLTGISAKDFIVQYTLKMVKDLQNRTNLNQKEIGEFLHFSSRYAILQFLKLYDRR